LHAGKQWALFNAEHKFSYDEDAELAVLEETLTEEKIVDATLTSAHFGAEYERLQRVSTYADRPMENSLAADNDLLDQRLRDLGYLQ
jgi:hypothetical protein